MTREELLKVAKPILFNTEMVQAILDDRKSVTRRVIKCDLYDSTKETSGDFEICDKHNQIFFENEAHFKAWTLNKCRYQKGDIIYVRETFRYVSIGEVTYEGECIWEKDVVQFKASEDEFYEKYRDYIGEYEKWKPSLHMPKDLARIFLKVTDVRVEKLKDITFADLIKEGICDYGEKTSSKKFPNLWDSTIKRTDLNKYSWESNPYVWVIEFERVEVSEKAK